MNSIDPVINAAGQQMIYFFNKNVFFFRHKLVYINITLPGYVLQFLASCFHFVCLPKGDILALKLLWKVSNRVQDFLKWRHIIKMH